MSWATTACIGVGFIVAGLALAASEHIWLCRAHIGHGTVAELIPTSSGRRTSYIPRVRFRAADGTEHEFRRSYASHPVGYVVGERVLVAYDPQTYEGRILSFAQRFGLAVVIVAVGLAMVFMAACFTLGSDAVPRIYQQQPKTDLIQ